MEWPVHDVRAQVGSHPAAAEAAERQGSGDHAVARNFWRVRVPPQRLQTPQQCCCWRSKRTGQLVYNMRSSREGTYGCMQVSSVAAMM